MGFPTFLKALNYCKGFDKWVYDELKKINSDIPSFSKCNEYRGGFNKYIYDTFKEINPSIPSYIKCLNYKGGYMRWVYDMITNNKVKVSYANVKIKVINAEKKGIGAANIILIDEYDNEYTNSSGSAGGCTIKKVPYGEYKVLATAKDYDDYKANEKLVINSDSVELNICMED